MKILELFAGSRCIGQEAERQGHKVFSVDWTAYDRIDLVADIGELKLSDIPFIPDIVWASPDCTTYSIAACGKHRNKNRSGKSEYAIKCDTVNKHWISLIKKWLIWNPNLIFFIENPRGILRHMGFMQEFSRHTVWYCKYGDNRAKPTDIWTNSKRWIPRPMCKNYKYDKDGNIINRHCHHESARRGAKTGTQGRKGSYERSKIPQQLCEEVIKSLTL
jgi:hypothetical protein